MNPPGKRMKRIALSKAFIEADVVIDIPTMKTHNSMQVSMGLKDMKGSIRWSNIDYLSDKYG